MMEATGLAETFLSAKLHGVISHNSVTFTLTSVRISELTLKLLSTLFFVEFFVPGWTNRGSKPGRGERFFFLSFWKSRSADWGPRGLLLNGYCGSFV